jgi:hypothetical protein
VKTSLVINDELYRQVKAKAALEGRKLTELIEEGLRHVLSGATGARTKSRAPRRVQLPLMRARPGDKPLFEGMSVDAIHQRLDNLQEAGERESHEASVRQ